jgi:hypothetical protein
MKYAGVDSRLFLRGIPIAAASSSSSSSPAVAPVASPPMVLRRRPPLADVSGCRGAGGVDRGIRVVDYLRHPVRPSSNILFHTKSIRSIASFGKGTAVLEAIPNYPQTFMDRHMNWHMGGRSPQRGQPITNAVARALV